MAGDQTYDVVFDPDYWGKHGAPHEVLAQLRDEHPVYWYDTGRFDAAWLLTRYKDVEYVGKNSKLFLSSPRTVLHNPQRFKSPLVGLPQMDAPLHTQHRRAMQGWFTPRVVRQFEDRMAQIASALVDDMAASQSSEFCSKVGSQLPLKMICEILGIPEEQEPVVLQLTRDVFSATDPGLAQNDDIRTGIRNAMAFCAELGTSRQQNPTDDFASTIANAKIDGERMSIQAIASHLMIMISAGHDTTASAINGGLLALIQNPEELDKLKQNPALSESAINEILRYVTPTTNFVRTAREDTEIDGVKIAKGQDVCIHFCAANRDEDQFECAQEFHVDRSPNRHLTFGAGPHACIGQLLARIEMQALFRELVPRIEQIELDGSPEYARAYWVTGLKRLPIRYRITPAQRA